jgi:hypothetical protein
MPPKVPTVKLPKAPGGGAVPKVDLPTAIKNNDIDLKAKLNNLDALRTKQAAGFGKDTNAAAVNNKAIKDAEAEVAKLQKAKNNLEASDKAAKGLKDPKQLSALDKLKKACVDNKMTCGAIVATAAVFAAAAIATAAKEAIDYKITKIEYVATNQANITFKPGQDIYTKDTVTFTATDCEPTIDGSYTDIRIVASNIIQIDLDAPLTKDGTKGDMKLDTDPLNQLKLAADKALKAAKNGICGVLPCDIFGSSGKTIWTIIIVAVMLCCFASSAYAAYTYSS